MYILAGRGLGDAPSREPWRVRLGLRPKPQYLRFLNLDQFILNKASLTPRLREMVESLAKHVRLSWKSMQPIGFIRLIGHTDNTGREKYNIGLGDRRARCVKEELEKILREDIRKQRIQIAILVEPSPGSSAPTADNRTREGRALNRRVEVFVAPPVPPPEPPKPEPTIKVPEPPPVSVIQTQPPTYPREVPTLPPGKSPEQWADEWLRDRHVPKLLRDRIGKAIFGKDFGALNSLLNAAGVTGRAKEAFLETVRALAKSPAR